jgi:FkbM family methyltransferase
MTPLLDNPPVRLKMCRHGPMMYLTNDLIGRSLDTYGEFSEFELLLFADILRPGMTVVDIGSNVGTHAVFFAQRVGSRGSVLAFEPQRFIHQLLCGNLALHALRNVRGLHAAVGEAPGVLKAPPIDYGAPGAFNFGAVEFGAWQEGEDVPLVTLDSLNLPRCDLIKVDIEGMELSALKGAAETIRRHRPMLHVENNRRATSEALLAWLLAQDYRLYWRITPYFNPANFFGATTDLFDGAVESNIIGVHRSAEVDVGGLPEVRDASAWLP